MLQKAISYGAAQAETYIGDKNLHTNVNGWIASYAADYAVKHAPELMQQAGDITQKIVARLADHPGRRRSESGDRRRLGRAVAGVASPGGVMGAPSSWRAGSCLSACCRLRLGPMGKAWVDPLKRPLTGRRCPRCSPMGSPTELHFDPRARSSAGAIGLMQVKPGDGARRRMPRLFRGIPAPTPIAARVSSRSCCGTSARLARGRPPTRQGR